MFDGALLLLAESGKKLWVAIRLIRWFILSSKAFCSCTMLPCIFRLKYWDVRFAISST